MCFWNTSSYRIYENQPERLLGTFGPHAYRSICPTFYVTDYVLLNGKGSSSMQFLRRFYDVSTNKAGTQGTLIWDNL